MPSQQFTVTEHAALLYWEELDTPISLGLWLRAKAGDWVGVLTTSVDPRTYLAPERALKDIAAVSFLKKSPFAKGFAKADRRKACVDKWYAGEALCFRTNNRIRSMTMRKDPALRFLDLVKRKLQWMLGNAPSDAEMQRRERFGPGSSFRDLVRSPTAADKYSCKPTVTQDAIWYLSDIVGTLWGAEMSLPYVSSSEDCIDVVRGNRFTTVNKTALIDRPIAIEPLVNLYGQLALGGCIRKRLLDRCGWDLDTAQTVHRKVAQIASYDDSYATIDLSNASDTCAVELVRYLLEGTGWLERMEDLRSKYTRVDDLQRLRETLLGYTAPSKEGKWKLLEKFSSMGNGFTFELETAIFAAIAMVSVELTGSAANLGWNVFVFGDDIIVPTESVDLVQKSLEFCGFELNRDKSFLSGPFRESCGGDFFLGVPVRGFYLKRELDEPDVCYSCYNGTKKVFDLCGHDGHKFLGWILSRLPRNLRRIGGPDRLGDSVLHGLRPVAKWKNGIRWIRAVKFEQPVVVDWRFFTERVRLACRLTGYGSNFGITSRGKIPTLELIWVSGS